MRIEIAGEIEHLHPFLGARTALPLGMVKRALDIGSSRRPMLLHGEARKFIVVGLGPIGRAPVNELHDGDGGIAAQAVEQLPIGVAGELLR